MPRDPRFDIMFEPVKIGPVTAPNRFYQVPHCTGIGYRKPQTLAALRETKAEGGWGTVCTEYCSIHPSSDDDPYPSSTIWDDDDVRALALMADKVHAHGALAGIELWHGGAASANHYSRETPIGPYGRAAGVRPGANPGHGQARHQRAQAMASRRGQTGSAGRVRRCVRLRLSLVSSASVNLECTYTERVDEIAAASVVMVTSRTPNDSLFYDIADRSNVRRIGDCLAPGTVATSVYSGHQYARELDEPPPADVRFRRERAVAP